MSSFNKKQFNKKRNISKVFVSIGIAIVVLGIAGLIVRLIMNKVSSNIPLASATTVYSTLLSKRTLVQKITELQTTLESYDAQITTATLLKAENTELKAELGRTVHKDGVLAHVLTVPNRSIYDTFVIDGGFAEGVRVGQTVYGFDNIALGSIDTVSDSHATVALFSTPGRSTSGTASGTDVAVTLIGRGSGEYEVRIPRTLQFQVGGLIAYQSTDTAVLAEIERIVTDPRDPFQRMIAKTPINLQALKWVIVR